MSDAQANEAEKNIEIWKVKKLIKRLEAARGMLFKCEDIHEGGILTGI
jgi:hypothetical protein